mmetsp:Transcript_82816/g.222135  ORF Transcript_82816/g.222135 Transcript_82816/m.222135 type:complete len:251 (-) Transcript_82816:31-783(-)
MTSKSRLHAPAEEPLCWLENGRQVTNRPTLISSSGHGVCSARYSAAQTTLGARASTGGSRSLCRPCPNWNFLWRWLAGLPIIRAPRHRKAITTHEVSDRRASRRPRPPRDHAQSPPPGRGRAQRIPEGGCVHAPGPRGAQKPGGAAPAPHEPPPRRLREPAAAPHAGDGAGVPRVPGRRRAPRHKRPGPRDTASLGHRGPGVDGREPGGRSARGRARLGCGRGGDAVTASAPGLDCCEFSAPRRSRRTHP